MFSTVSFRGGFISRAETRAKQIFVDALGSGEVFHSDTPGDIILRCKRWYFEIVLDGKRCWVSHGEWWDCVVTSDGSIRVG